MTGAIHWRLTHIQQLGAIRVRKTAFSSLIATSCASSCETSLYQIINVMRVMPMESTLYGRRARPPPLCNTPAPPRTQWHPVIKALAPPSPHRTFDFCLAFSVWRTTSRPPPSADQHSASAVLAGVLLLGTRNVRTRTNLACAFPSLVHWDAHRPTRTFSRTWPFSARSSSDRLSQERTGWGIRDSTCQHR